MSPDRVPTPTPSAPPPRRRGQFGLRTALLAVAAVAVWTTYVLDRSRNAWLSARIKVVRPLARELDLSDPGKVAVVKREELWFDENRWDIYLPPGDYRICLATRQIGADGLLTLSKAERFPAGRRTIALEQQRTANGWTVAVTWGPDGRLTFDEPADWDPRLGSTGGGHFTTAEVLPADDPVVLLRRRFTSPDAGGQVRTPTGPANGLLLWVERTGPGIQSP